MAVTAGSRLAAHDAESAGWIAALSDRLDPRRHVVGGEPEPVLRREGEGWRVGRVAGEVRMDGRRLVIRAEGADTGDIRALLARLWCEGIEGATRHGPPAFRTEMPHVGGSLRGRLDVRGSIRLRSSGSSYVASVYRTRNLDNDISRALVAAERALTRQLGHDRWRTRRVREVLPELGQAVGRRSPVPSLGDLGRIRYTPITRPYRDVAELSVRILHEDPIVTTAERGRPQGLLLPEAVAGRLALEPSAV